MVVLLTLNIKATLLQYYSVLVYFLCSQLAIVIIVEFPLLHNIIHQVTQCAMSSLNEPSRLLGYFQGNYRDSKIFTITQPYLVCVYISVNLFDFSMAKIKMDDQPFFSKQLHICYAPEYETIEETRQKLQERRKVIAKKTRGMYECQ